MWGFLIALISGALMSIQGVFNSAVTKQASLWTANSFVQVTGFLTCIIIWFFAERQESFMNLVKIEPKYLLLGGIMGAGITYTVIKSISSLGPAKSAMLIVAAQLIVSYLIEVFGLFGVEKASFHWSKFIGVLLFLCGIFIFKWKS